MPLNNKKIPKHIAIIMDGNGRWAKKRRLPKIKGHHAGVSAVERTIESCLEIGVKVLTLYTFSTENWKRSKLEVRGLMGLLGYYLKKYLPSLQKNKVKVVISGKIDALPTLLERQLQDVVRATKNNNKLILNLALNYGAREEILHVTRNIAKNIKSGNLQPREINEKVFSTHLYTKDLPDPDLLIRTSGEYRLSNFLLWQISYSELYFTPKLWPDFKGQDLIEAILDYQRRERRFGGR